jgi:NAD(P)-dependent dehydrogenase (short-subunit alcohol dehydrogenase family)
MKPENCMEKVTGASKGIAAEIAKRFAAGAASVVVNYASSKKDWDKTRKTLSLAATIRQARRNLWRGKGIYAVLALQYHRITKFYCVLYSARAR